MIGRVSFTTIDAVDPDQLAAFWCEVLGTEVEETSDEGRFVFLGEANGYVLSFQRVPEPKSVKNRMHLDIVTPDIHREAARLEALGARQVAREERSEHGSTWVLMEDPEGNEFCICDGGTGGA